MKKHTENISPFINTVIDDAVKEDRYLFDMYNFLKLELKKRSEVNEFLNGFLVKSMLDEIYQLELYLGGGSDVADLREVYGWMGKPRARKFKDYLLKIIEDAKRYERERRPGRKPGSKNKQSKVANK